MKAGSAGSNPDGAAKSASSTQPLRYFLREVGEAVANLNTTVVGLDAVENGYEKPDGLNISWNPTDPKSAARKARRFVLEAVLVRVSEALAQYVATVAKFSRFDSCRTNWNKKKTAENKSDPSIADKLADIAMETVGPDCYKTSAACLLIHWRNRVVHSKSEAKLTPKQITKLKDSSDFIETNYAGLSIQRLLEDFETGKPTLKDISSLIAMTIRLVRLVDENVKDYSGDDLKRLLDHYGLCEQIEKVRAETSPDKVAASIKRLLKATAPGLGESYEKFYGS